MEGRGFGDFLHDLSCGFFWFAFFFPHILRHESRGTSQMAVKKKYFSSLQQEQVVPRGEGLEAKMGKCVTQSCGLHGSCAHA